MTSPCLDCKERISGCHANCSAYKLFKGVSDYRKQKIQKERTKEYEITSAFIDNLTIRKY